MSFSFFRSSVDTIFPGTFREYSAPVASGPKLVNVVYIRTPPRALGTARPQGKYTRQYYAGLELHAELKRGGRFDYMHRFELHKRDGPGVAGHVIELVPKKKLVHS